jgi:hypothetical protein
MVLSACDLVMDHVLEQTGVPLQSREPHWPKFSVVETQEVDITVQNLLEKGAIEHVAQEPDQFLSHIFLRDKKDGSKRPVFHFKKLNIWMSMLTSKWKAWWL